MRWYPVVPGLGGLADLKLKPDAFKTDIQHPRYRKNEAADLCDAVANIFRSCEHYLRFEGADVVEEFRIPSMLNRTVYTIIRFPVSEYCECLIAENCIAYLRDFLKQIDEAAIRTVGWQRQISPEEQETKQ